MDIGKMKRNIDNKFFYAIHREKITPQEWHEHRINLLKDLNYDAPTDKQVSFDDIMNCRAKKEEEKSKLEAQQLLTQPIKLNYI